MTRCNMRVFQARKPCGLSGGVAMDRELLYVARLSKGGSSCGFRLLFVINRRAMFAELAMAGTGGIVRR